MLRQLRNRVNRIPLAQALRLLVLALGLDVLAVLYVTGVKLR